MGQNAGIYLALVANVKQFSKKKKQTPIYTPIKQWVIILCALNFH